MQLQQIARESLILKKVLEHGRDTPVSKLMRELGVSRATMYRWVSRVKMRHGYGRKMMSDSDALEKARHALGVTRFFRKHVKPGQRVFSLPGERPRFETSHRWQSVCAEKDPYVFRVLMHNTHHVEYITEELDGQVVPGLKHDKFRLLHTSISEMIKAPASMSPTMAEAYREKWLRWDGVWLDLCSTISAPEAGEIFRLLPQACQQHVIPIALTVQRGREKGRVLDVLQHVPKDFRDEARLTMLKSFFDGKLKILKVQNYQNPAPDDYHGAPMMLVMGLLDNRKEAS